MEIVLKSARLRFCDVFQPSAMGEGEPAYSISAVFEPESQAHKTLRDAITAVAKEKWTDKAGDTLKVLKANNKLCLGDGELKADKGGYDGMMFVSARNVARPTVVDRDRTPLTAADGKIYPGCYVNLILDVWPQDHVKYGKRVNAKLLGVQFVKNGEPFGSGGKKAASLDQFEDIGEDEDEEVTL
jgi:hypothetical protein